MKENYQTEFKLHSLLSGLIADSFLPKKPSLRMDDIIDNKQIANVA